jgi:hypothetical protein
LLRYKKNIGSRPGEGEMLTLTTIVTDFGRLKQIACEYLRVFTLFLIFLYNSEEEKCQVNVPYTRGSGLVGKF